MMLIRTFRKAAKISQGVILEYSFEWKAELTKLSMGKRYFTKGNNILKTMRHKMAQHCNELKIVYYS